MIALLLLAALVWAIGAAALPPPSILHNEGDHDDDE